MLVQRYPELFQAFIGTGQMIAFLENDRMCYDFALAWAWERGDTGKLAKLTQQGPPPYYGHDVAWQDAAFLMDTFNYMNANPAIADNGATFRDLADPNTGCTTRSVGSAGCWIRWGWSIPNCGTSISAPRRRNWTCRSTS